MIYTKEYYNELTYKIIGSAIEVHKYLGPGLLENVYQKCLAREFITRGLEFISEGFVELNYKGLVIEPFLRYDFLIEDSILLEIKSVDALSPIFNAQLLSYMKLLKIPKGVLINFNVTNIYKEGQKTLVNEFFIDLPD
jgi:GxxExxY protein